MQLQERILQLMKDSSNSLSLTFKEFCHIRSVITRADFENLLFNEKLYADITQGKLCFTCRKVHFNLLTFTFGTQCNVCKQKVCKSCVTQIALPKDRQDDLPIQAFTPVKSTKSLSNSERCHSLDMQSPVTTAGSRIPNGLNYNNDERRRRLTQDYPLTKSKTARGCTEPIDICTDCFFLLQQMREKFRQRHVSPTVPTISVPSQSSSLSSSFCRSRNSSSQSTSAYHLTSSSSASSLATLLAQQQQQQIHHSLAVKNNFVSSNLKQTRSVQELAVNSSPLTTTTKSIIMHDIEKVSLSRQNLFLKLQSTHNTT